MRELRARALVALLVFSIFGTPCALTGGAPGPGLVAQLGGGALLGCA